jgi:hypothetical protein
MRIEANSADVSAPTKAAVVCDMAGETATAVGRKVR